MVGPRLLVPNMGVRILLPEHFLFQVNMYLVSDKSQNWDDLDSYLPKTQTNKRKSSE
jgi:hypothetical protein